MSHHQQPGPFGYTRPLLLSEIILGAQQFSPLSICRGFFKMNLGGHCCVCGKQFQTPFHYVSLHINRMIFLFFMSNFHDCRISLLEINTCIDAGGHYVWYFLSAVVWYQKRKVPPAKKNTKTYTCLHRKWVLPLRWLLPIISNIIIYYLINLIVMDPTCTTCTTLSTLMFRDVSTTIRLTLLWDAHLRPRIAAHLFGSCDCAAAVGPVGRPPWISHGHSMPFHAIHRGWNGLNRNRMK